MALMVLEERMKGLMNSLNILLTLQVVELVNEEAQGSLLLAC
jgi:hypothetical protein